MESVLYLSARPCTVAGRKERLASNRKAHLWLGVVEAQAHFADVALGFHHVIEHEMINDHHGIHSHLRVRVI
jgi:hypothetical protein